MTPMTGRQSRLPVSDETTDVSLVAIESRTKSEPEPAEVINPTIMSDTASATRSRSWPDLAHELLTNKDLRPRTLLLWPVIIFVVAISTGHLRNLAEFAYTGLASLAVFFLDYWVRRKT